MNHTITILTPRNLPCFKLWLGEGPYHLATKQVMSTLLGRYVHTCNEHLNDAIELCHVVETCDD